MNTGFPHLLKQQIQILLKDFQDPISTNARTQRGTDSDMDQG